MKKYPILLASITLFFAACNSDAGMPPQAPESNTRLTVEVPETKAAPISNVASIEPLDTAEWPDNGTALVSRARVVLKDGTVLGEEPEASPSPEELWENKWHEWSYEDRHKVLKRMAKLGNEWAAETVRQLEEGNAHPRSLDDVGARFAREVQTLPKPRPASNSGLPMPFGKSMFGPWDTGGGPVDP